MEVQEKIYGGVGRMDLIIDVRMAQVICKEGLSFTQYQKQSKWIS